MSEFKGTNKDLAENIYEDLNKKGAGLGNASIIHLGFVDGYLDMFIHFFIKV